MVLFGIPRDSALMPLIDEYERRAPPVPYSTARRRLSGNFGKLSDQGLDRYELVCHVFPNQDTVGIDQKIEALGTGVRTFPARAIHVDNTARRIADELILRRDLLLEYVLRRGHIAGNAHDVDIQCLEFVMPFTELGELARSTAGKGRRKEREQDVAVKIIESQCGGAHAGGALEVWSGLSDRRSVVVARRLQLTEREGYR